MKVNRSEQFCFHRLLSEIVKRIESSKVLWKKSHTRIQLLSPNITSHKLHVKVWIKVSKSKLFFTGISKYWWNLSFHSSCHFCSDSFFSARSFSDLSSNFQRVTLSRVVNFSQFHFSHYFNFLFLVIFISSNFQPFISRTFHF